MSDINQAQALLGASLPLGRKNSASLFSAGNPQCEISGNLEGEELSLFACTPLARSFAITQ